MSVYHNMMTDEQKLEGLKSSHAILSKKSLCETCLRANKTCPIWEPGKYVEECVEHRPTKAPNK